MREVKQDTYINEPFYMSDSGDYATGITSLGFANSGDIQLETPNSGFIDITSGCWVTERGFGWYRLQSSVSNHANALGRNTIHISETDSLSAWPAEIPVDVVANRAADVYTPVNSTYTAVGSLTAQLTAHDTNLNTKWDALIGGIAAGTVIAGLVVVSPTDPLVTYRKNNWNGTIYLSSTFSSYVSSEYPVWFTAYDKVRNGEELWSVQGSVSNTNSMSAVFSLDPNSHTNVEPSAHYKYEIQFRDGAGTVIANAQAGTLDHRATLKL